MSLLAKVGLVLGLLFTGVNVWGLVYAVLKAEWLHAGTHAVLLVLAGIALWRFAPRLSRQRVASY
jgi:hypothetical protein